MYRNLVSNLQSSQEAEYNRASYGFVLLLRVFLLQCIYYRRNFLLRVLFVQGHVSVWYINMWIVSEELTSSEAKRADAEAKLVDTVADAESKQIGESDNKLFDAEAKRADPETKLAEREAKLEESEHVIVALQARASKKLTLSSRNGRHAWGRLRYVDREVERY